MALGWLANLGKKMRINYEHTTGLATSKYQWLKIMTAISLSLTVYVCQKFRKDAYNWVLLRFSHAVVVKWWRLELEQLGCRSAWALAEHFQSQGLST